MFNKKERAPYMIEYINVKEMYWAKVISFFIIIFSIVILLGIAFGITCLYVYVAKYDKATLFWETFGKNLDGGAVLFSTTLTLFLTLIIQLLDKKLKIISLIVNKILFIKHLCIAKKYASNKISDNTFKLANTIISHIEKTSDNTSKFYDILAPYKINYLDLIYGVYQQLYGIWNLVDDLENDISKKKIKHILLYDFSIASGNITCREMLEAYKNAEQISDVIIIANMNYLPYSDQMMIQENLKSEYTLANSIYKLIDENVFLINPALNYYNISLSATDVFTNFNPTIISLIILDEIFGFIPCSALKFLFTLNERLKVLSFAKKKKLFGRRFKVSDKKAYKLNRIKVSNFLRCSNSKDIYFNSLDNNLLRKLRNYLYEKEEMICAHLELSALINCFDEKTEKSIDRLLDKDCFNAAHQRIILFPDSPQNNSQIIYRAIINERCGDIENTNKLLSQVKGLPLSVNENGVLTFNVGSCEDIKLFNKFAFVLFENTHGKSENRKTILKVVNNIKSLSSSISMQDLEMYEYWELHINLEEGIFSPNNYFNWITNYKKNYPENNRNYSYLHNLRRAYSDYSNSTYLSVLENFSNNDCGDVCYKMLNTVRDSQMIDDLTCYSSHMRRMAIGDLIMNYCLPFLYFHSKPLPSIIQSFLYENGYNQTLCNITQLSRFALTVYQNCCVDFNASQDKSEKTTKTRICAIRMMNHEEKTDYEDLDEEIKNFYLCSDFEVFKAYGIALRLKLYILQFFDINCKSAAIMQEMEMETDFLTASTLKKNDNELKSIIEKIIKLYKEEILSFGFDNFSNYSKNRFKLLLCYLNIIKLFLKETNINGINKELETILRHIDFTDLYGIEKYIMTQLAPLMEKNDSDKKSLSYKDCWDMLKFYPIILL